MRTNQSIPSWDEIVFENRNKLFGAYDLRKKYSSRLLRSFAITISSFILLLFGLIYFQNLPQAVVPTETKTDSVYISEYVVDKPIDTRIIETPFVKTTNRDDNSYMLVDTVRDDIERDTLSSSFSAATATTGSGDSVSVSSSSNAFPSEGPALNFNDTFALSGLDQMPEYPGGIDKFTEYIIDNLRFTEEAKGVGLSERVPVRFVVNTDGLISNVRITKKVGFGMDENIIKTLIKSRKWTPGMVKGRPVNTEFILPLAFSLR